MTFSQVTPFLVGAVISLVSYALGYWRGRSFERRWLNAARPGVPGTRSSDH